MSKNNIRKINDLIVKAAKATLGTNRNFGKTDDWFLSELKWLKIEQLYKMSISKMTHKIINGMDDSYFKNYLISSRNIRNFENNKIGKHSPTMGFSIHTQQTFLYQIIQTYNRLPNELTKM